MVYYWLAYKNRWNHDGRLDNPPLEAPLEVSGVDPGADHVDGEKCKGEVQATNSFLDDESFPKYDKKDVNHVSKNSHKTVICRKVEGWWVKYLPKVTTHAKN